VGVDDHSATRLGPGASVGTVAPSASSFDDGGFTPGTILQARYRIVGLIGRGGMGEVYRAQDLKLGQSVALKFLPQDMARERARLERFLSEVRIARQISHPNVCRVYDVGEIDGRHFLSMEFVDGEDLASLLRRIGRLPPDKGVEIARQVCAGLAAAHDRGVLHRDLKPANIMIDGRGHARLADFGLAAAGADVRPGEVAGTPAYMAPEQLEGQELSTKSDIYALGLVLHEVFTGKRLFDGASIQELRDQHRSRSGSRGTGANSSIDVDPAVELVIRRCIEPDPRNRPASALAVAAALPGGDPLAAALAAGETPSPELLAESGAAGTLTPATAWMLIAAVVLGVLATAWFAERVRFYRLVPGIRPPDVLAARAEDLIDAAGYGDARVDRIYGVRDNASVPDYVREHDQRRDRWEQVARVDAPAVHFWYRQSRQPLIPQDSTGAAGPDDPPLLTTDMVTVLLSPGGRLWSFRAVPPENQPDSSGTDASTDWSRFFAAAGIDDAALTPVQPRRTPSIYADSRRAWEGRYPGRPDWTIRVEAGSYRGRPVWFEVVGPWDLTPASPRSQAGGLDVLRLAERTVQIGLGVLLVVLCPWLASRNVRAGRADQRGALIVGMGVGTSAIATWLVGRHHAGTIDVIWGLFLGGLALALLWSVVTWVTYLALEPFVRRRWPHAMISWTRLLAGRFKDPMVARDVLLGCVGGVAIAAAGDIARTLPEWLGQPPITPGGTDRSIRSLGPLAMFVAEILNRPMRILMESFAFLFLILLSHLLLRNRWAANSLVAVMIGALVINREAVLLSAASAVVFVAILIGLISRVGVLAYVAAWFVVFASMDLPLSFDQSVWYAARSMTTAILMLAVAGWGFYHSLGGRSPFGNAFET